MINKRDDREGLGPRTFDAKTPLYLTLTHLNLQWNWHTLLNHIVFHTDTQTERHTHGRTNGRAHEGTDGQTPL